MPFNKDDLEIFDNTFEPLLGLTQSTDLDVPDKYREDAVDIKAKYLPVTPNQVGSSNTLKKAIDIYYEIYGIDLTNYFVEKGFAPGTVQRFGYSSAGVNATYTTTFDPTTVIAGLPIKRMAVLIWGGGGGGGGGAGNNGDDNWGGGGGGGGASGNWKLQLIDNVPQEVLTIKVGGGGIYGTMSGNNDTGNPGTTGKTSSITYSGGTLISAVGGSGGGGGKDPNDGRGGGAGGVSVGGSGGGAGGAGGNGDANPDADGADGKTGGIAAARTNLILKSGTLSGARHATGGVRGLGGDGTQIGTTSRGYGGGGGGGGGGSLRNGTQGGAGGAGAPGNASATAVGGAGAPGCGGGGGGGGGGSVNIKAGTRGGSGGSGGVYIYY